MNKKIILSLAIVGVVAGVVSGLTIAYFSDTETSTGNTFTAGTIDIAVNDQNPWSQNGEYTFSGLEPSDSKDIDVVLKNVGTNPVVIWKKVSATEGETYTSEPKCDALKGDWTDGTPGTCSESTVSGDFTSQFVYSMKIGGGDNIKKDWDVRVSDVNDLWIPLGRLNPDSTLVVDQNYYFDEMAGNAYQGEYMTLNITFYAEQLDAPGPAYVAGSNGVVLDNKDAASGTWEPIVGDGTWGILTWEDGGDYRIRAWGLQTPAGAKYQLRAWDFATDSHVAWLSGVEYTTTDVNDTGNYVDFAQFSKKYWLQETTGMNHDNTLWEANLVNNN